jgi:hypothetical protein
MFDWFVKQPARRGLLNVTYYIGSIDVKAMPQAKCYDPTVGKYYHGDSCTLISTGAKLPIASELTESGRASKRRQFASYVT